MKRKLPLFFIFILFPFFIHAQSLQDDVFQMLMEADQAAKRNHFQEALDITIRAKDLIGRTDEQIQLRMVRALIGLKNWDEALTQSAVFYRLSQSNSSYEYLQMQQMERIINENLQLENQAYQDALNFPSLSLCEKYFNNYPSGRNIAEVRAIYARVKADENLWQETLKVGSFAAYLKYVNSFASGLHAEEAGITIKEMDEKAYQNAVQKGTQTALNSYLSTYTNGNFRNEISVRLAERKDFDAFQQAKSTNYISDYENYLITYPSGKFASDANDILRNSYYTLGEEAYKAKKWSEAQKYFSKYLEKYPYGDKIDEVKRKNKKSFSMQNQSGLAFLGLQYQSLYPFGITFGRMNVGKSGFYTTFRANPEVLKFFSLSSIDSLSQNNYVYTGNYAETRFSFSLGPTFKLIYPLWIYAGIGLNYIHKIAETEEYDAFGGLIATHWTTSFDNAQFMLYPEIGLMFKPGSSLMFGYGIMRLNSENLHAFQLGFGIGSGSANSNAQKRREDRRAKQHNSVYWIYTNSSALNMAMSIGSLKTKGLGFYMSGGINSDLLKASSAIWEIDDAGNTTSIWGIARTGKTMQSNWGVSSGTTFKLLYPVWAYAGIGFVSSQQFDEVDEYDLFGDFYDTVWMKNTDQKNLFFSGEYGALLRIKAFSFRYGIKQLNGDRLKEWGIGFSF